MARTSRQVRLEPSATGQRPRPIAWTGPGFTADIGGIYADQLDDNSVMLVPPGYIIQYSDDYDELWDVRWQEESGKGQCWQTTVIYEEHISKTHPHLVPFLRRDPWTAFPVLAKPSGPTLVDFIRQNRASMYSTPLDSVSSRILPLYRPLMYQWALHLISGLSFVHAHDIIFGDLNLNHCWLSSDSHLSLSLVGFVNAGFRRRTTGVWHPCDYINGEMFHPVKLQSDTTKQTDMFLYGCVVYELMTGFWPGERRGKSNQEIAMMIPRREWPPLEIEHMGEIVHKCWKGDFADAEQLKAEVVAFLEGLGWRIEGNDDLQGFDVADLSLKPTV